MTSSATNNGAATVTIYFRQRTDPDVATVVDDAIVVVEVIQAKFDEGYNTPSEISFSAIQS